MRSVVGAVVLATTQAAEDRADGNNLKRVRLRFMGALSVSRGGDTAVDPFKRRTRQDNTPCCVCLAV